MTRSTDPARDLLHQLAPVREHDHVFMAQALAEAKRAWGRTAPNPMVGSVIVSPEGEVLGRGYHKRAGLDHGEIDALKNARASGHDPRGATLYVNLEPCAFHGRTPPCSDACIKAGLGRVVIGVVDPHPKVSGEGIRRLLEAGIEVTCGVLEEDCRSLNAPFFTRVLHGRPHVTAKVAMSLDGKIATRAGDSFPLTGEEARARVHLLRDRLDAILVGRRTAELDNPRLTCRLPVEQAAEGGPRDPVRVVLDPRAQLPLGLHLFQLKSSAGSKAITIAVVDSDAPLDDSLRRLDDLGVSVIRSPRLVETGRFDVRVLLGQLVEHDINSVLIEGGGNTLAGFLQAGCIDAWVAHIAPVFIGGSDAPTPLDGLGVERIIDGTRANGALRVTRLGQDIEIAAPVAGDLHGLD